MGEICFRTALLACLAAFSVPPAAGQAPPSDGYRIGGVAVTGSLRTRVESWDWFGGTSNSDYTYPGSLFRLSFSASRRGFDWQVEFAVPFLLGLPDTAIAPGAQGQLGLGATYFAANGRESNAAMIFPKQAFLRFKELGGVAGQSLQLGRFEFNDGAEIAPKDATLAALKRDRISQRLLGAFGFSHVGRSFDGVRYALNGSRLNFTALAARPTRGAFQVDGWGELNANVYYGALTGQLPGKRSNAEWRVFGLGYSDYRDGVLKTDSRPASARAADAGHIHIGTYGGHYIQTIGTSAGTADLLLWGALQSGSWGALTQRSGAFAAEAGWQPRILPAVRPWIRGGYDWASGDGNPNDRTHGTFFEVLPTPRIYARFPFFNLMNIRDAFGELILRPSKSVTVRVDGHSLALADRNDLWYSGGGMFQPWTFGYTGRPSNGHAGLATLFDASVDYTVNRHVSANFYYGHAAGKSVIDTIYPAGKNANFGYLELIFR